MSRLNFIPRVNSKGQLCLDYLAFSSEYEILNNLRFLEFCSFWPFFKSFLKDWDIESARSQVCRFPKVYQIHHEWIQFTLSGTMLQTSLPWAHENKLEFLLYNYPTSIVV